MTLETKQEKGEFRVYARDGGLWIAINDKFYTATEAYHAVLHHLKNDPQRREFTFFKNHNKYIIHDEKIYKAA
jgi:hypothetical protein